ncbi:MAG TPA: hypothetical protein VHW94_13155 [Candidatus Dormibacteraeota bacterium]|nr:hypothetical protein [Candidatus Dormibacteraeota bacterium]
MASSDTAPPQGLTLPVDARRGPPRAKPRTLHLGGRDYPVVLPTLRDPRMHVAAVLLTLQALGQTVLGFRLSIAQILICLATGALIEFVIVFFKDHAIIWPASGLLTGNSTAFILRVPGTLHGQWWSTHGIEIFIGVVALGMATKYLIRWKGRHIFNPSNVALVLAFVVLGVQHTEPLDLWWIPMGLWMAVTYVILVGGGLLIAWELKMLGLVFGFMIAFAAFLAIALSQAPDHCMVASWRVAPMCGRDLWTIMVTSPEVLIFALFMIPDPRTVPDGALARVVFGVIVAMLAVLLIGPTTLEFWTKTAILGSLVIACALRFALVAFLAPFVAEGAGLRWMLGGFRWQVPAALAVALVCLGALPVAADISATSPTPFAELPDGSTPKVSATVGSGPATAVWVSTTASAGLPPPGGTSAGSASARVWLLPAYPTMTVAANVRDFDPNLTSSAVNEMAHDIVLDLIIESEARRSHDLKLAQGGASDDALTEFTDVIKQDIGSKTFVQKTYTFDKLSLQLYLPKFATQASRLEGIYVHGIATLTTRDASGNVLSRTSSTYAKTWGLGGTPQDITGDPTAATNQVISIDYTGLAPAP